MNYESLFETFEIDFLINHGFSYEVAVTAYCNFKENWPEDWKFAFDKFIDEVRPY